jgi:streptogramin lyase
VTSWKWLCSAGLPLFVLSGCVLKDHDVALVRPQADASLAGRGGAGGTSGRAGSAGSADGGKWDGSSGAGGTNVDGGGFGGFGGIAGFGGSGGAAGSVIDAGDPEVQRSDVQGDAGVDSAVDRAPEDDADVDASIDAREADVRADGSGGAGGATSGGAGGATSGGTGGATSGGAGGATSGGTGGATSGGTGGATSGGTGGTGGAVGGTGGASSGGTAGASGGAGGSPDGGSPDAGSGTIVEFPIPTANAGAHDIAGGWDGNAWFTEETGNKIGRIAMDGKITEYPIPTANAKPRGIAASGGRMYFTEFGTNKIGFFETSNPGAITEVSSLNGPTGIVATEDGTVWYTAVGANEVVKINADGTTAGRWTTPSSVGGPISFIGTGALYLGAAAQGRIDALNPLNAQIAAIPFIDDGVGAPITDILRDWNDDVWFLDGAVLRQYAQFSTFNAYAAPGVVRSLVAGPLGTPTVQNLYITMPAANAILVRAAGVFTQYPVPTPNSTPHDIVNGGDGNLWFTEKTGNQIGRLVP